MADLEPIDVRLLGRPAIECGGLVVEPPPGKTSAVLLYLAFHGGWVGRDELLYLFWPDVPHARASGNLRPLLYRLRDLPYAGGVERERRRVRWAVPTDLYRFRAAVADGRWLEAWETVGGELLAGFSLTDAGEFATWLDAERRELAAVVRGVGGEAARLLGDRGDHQAEASVWSALRRIDPLDEEALRSHISALARLGAQSEALTGFERFRLMLAEEVGGEPEEATLQAIADIRSGRLHPEVAQRHRAGRSRAAAMPLQTTRFLGRRAELDTIGELLRDEACRLVTIVGPGGIGKTRLALQAAADAAVAFEDGAHFVDLAPLTSAEELVGAIRRTLGPGVLDEGDLDELLERLRDRRALLVLDNLEHLIEEARVAVGRILATVPAVTVLATSRIRLELGGERLLDLDGLRYPDPARPGAADGEDPDHDAVALFLRAARRTRPDLRPGDRERHAIEGICAAVEGSPLALELAASWLRTLTLEEIAEELADDAGLLEAPGRGAPRHASMRAVFDHSWNLLSMGERRTLLGLASFRGGWTREAADRVAGVTLSELRAVMDASLVRRLPSGRFDWHPLVGGLVVERSRERADEHERLEARHARYYLDTVADRARAHVGFDGSRLLGEVEAELPNVQAAWRWALAHGEEDLLVASEEALHLACFGSNRLALLVGLLRHTVDGARPGGRLHGVALCTLGFTLCVGTAVPPYGPDPSRGLALVEAGLPIVEQRGTPEQLVRALRWTGESRAVCGLADEARTAFERELELHVALGDREGEAMMRCHIAQMEPDPVVAIAALREAVEFAEASEQLHPLSIAAGSLGEWLLAFAGAYDEAVTVLERANRLYGRTGTRYFAFHGSLLVADALIGAGDVARAHEALQRARRQRDALGADRSATDRASIALREADLALLDGAADEAERACQEIIGAGRDGVIHELRARSLLARIALERGDGAALAKEVAAGTVALADTRSGAVLTPNPWTTFLAQGEVAFLDVACAAALARGAVSQAHDGALDALATARASRQRPLASVAVGTAVRVLEERGETAAARGLASLVARSPHTPALTRKWLLHLDRDPDVDGDLAASSMLPAGPSGRDDPWHLVRHVEGLLAASGGRTGSRP